MKLSKNLKTRWLLIKRSFVLAFMRPKEELTDTIMVAQWSKYNKSFVVTRSINHLLGLHVGQLAIIKNEPPRVNIDNKKFSTWVEDGLYKSLKKNAKNTPAYEKFHVRKVKMRTQRKYR